jgi:hypothetical protein
VAIAAASGAETIATGEVLEGSTLGGSPFCVGGTILDTHGSPDPAEEPHGLIDRTITCPDGTVRGGLDTGGGRTGGAAGPDPDGLVDDRQRHRCLRGTTREREMEVIYDPDDVADP